MSRRKIKKQIQLLRLMKIIPDAEEALESASVIKNKER